MASIALAVARRWSQLGQLQLLQRASNPTVIPRRQKRAWLPDPLELATGLERRQLCAELRGDADPFDLRASPRGVSGAGTRECPNVVHSAFSERMVGCVCHPGHCHVYFFWLVADVPRRCKCGYWFRLEHRDPV